MPFYVQVILLGAIGLAWVWIPLMFFAGNFLGWYDLARRYPRRTPGPGCRHGTTSLILPPFGHYARVVLYARDADNLHLRLLPLFLFHPPMSIPWAEIEVIGPHPTSPGLMMTMIGGRDVCLPASLLEEELRVRAMAPAE